MASHPKLQLAWISPEEYLKRELLSETKHELVDGQIYAMSGASRNHERIAGNVYRKLGNHLEGKPCEAFSSDLKVRAGNNFFYPDAMVVCEENIPHEYYTHSPILIVEVLSKSTRRLDETTKRLAYFNIPSLQEYVLIEQDIVDVEVCRRSRSWVSEHYFLGDSVHFACIDLTVSVEELYSRVENDDVRSYLQERQKTSAPETDDASATDTLA
jgi:Uma2 family endonuclease